MLFDFQPLQERSQTQQVIAKKNRDLTAIDLGSALVSQSWQITSAYMLYLAEPFCFIQSYRLEFYEIFIYWGILELSK